MRIVLSQVPDIPTATGWVPHLGLAYLGTALRSKGHEVRIVDPPLDRLDVAGAATDILSRAPDLVGLTAYSCNRLSAMALATELRRRAPALPILGGGLHFTPTVEDALRVCPAIDAVVRGEGEATLVEIADRLSRGEGYDGVAGVTWRAPDGELVRNPDRPRATDLDALGMPAWDLFDLPRYDGKLLGEGETRNMAVQSSRGCPYECVFCYNHGMWGRAVRFRAPKLFVDEVEWLHKEHGFDGFEFSNDTFIARKAHARDICDEILRRKLRIKWFARTQVNTIDPEVFAHMRRAGAVVATFGIESGSDRILKLIKKNYTAEAAYRAVKMTSDAGFITRALFILAHPGETLADVKLTYDLMDRLKKLPRVSVECGFMEVYPGTPLAEKAVKQGLLPADFSWNSPATFDWAIRLGYPRHMVPYVPEGLAIEEIKLYAHTRKSWSERAEAALRQIRRVRNLDDALVLARLGVELGRRLVARAVGDRLSFGK